MKRGCVLTILWLMAGCLSLPGADLYRVEWLSGRTVQSLRLDAGSGPLRICHGASPADCITVPPGNSATCALRTDFFQCNAARASMRLPQFTAASPSPFILTAGFKNRAHAAGRKSAQVLAAEIKVTRGKTRIILPVDLETYVAGVLEGEAGILRSPHALQAMAVVARTWAVRSRGRHRQDGFDFCSLTHCQVFAAPSTRASQVSEAASRAVHETSGQVLKFNGQLIDVYFSADCGGMTEAAQNIWPDRAAPYLVSAKDPYCAGSGHSSWRQPIPLARIAWILNQSMAIPIHGPLQNLTVEARDNSGRARVLRLHGGSSRRIDANEFRYAVDRILGWNTLKSNLYTIERRGDALVFKGRGLGHGVGLCQAGAERMGQLGISEEKILVAYFPGTQLARLPEVAESDPVLSSEHFELDFPDSQEPLANETLRSLEAARREFSARLGKLPDHVKVETFDTTVDFVNASGLPGWAAGSTDGRSILLQPLSTLKRKKILNSTLRHELAHLVVHARRSPKIPRWFEEGLVLFLTREKPVLRTGYDFKGRGLEECISKPRSDDEMKAAYALAFKRVSRIARERGHAGLWKILEDPTEGDLELLAHSK